MSSSAPSASAPRPARIGEIDGLRGIALTLVVVFHLFGHGRVSGGVDVFLLVSGFLLTMSLGRALQTGRPLGIVARWGRTFSRLAPPAAIVLIAVMIGAYTVLPATSRGQTLVEVLSSAVYVENWQLISSQLAYGAAGPETSPLQHFWSLSVQGQFFLAFPLVALVIALVLRSPRARARVFWAALSIATAASFAYAAWYTTVSWQAAYLDTFARFWELGLGGLVAGLHLAGRALPAPVRPVAGWVGLAAVVASGFIIDGGRHYPGPLALVPVLGAVLVLLSSGTTARASVGTLLRTRPLRALDGISYGLYLWHWPILIAFLTIRERESGDLGWRGALVVLAASIACTIATRWILRAPTAWATSAGRRRAIAFALAAVVAGAAPSAALAAHQHAIDTAPVAIDDCAGAAALDAERPECADVDRAPGDFVPALAQLKSDDANRPECWAGIGATEANVCELGDQDGDLRILAVGDSHNSVYIDAYDEIGAANGWRIDAASRAGCAWLAEEAVTFWQDPPDQAACTDWRAAISERAASGDYDAIIVSNSSRSPVDPPAGESDMAFQQRMLEEAWAHRHSEDVPIIALRDFVIFGWGATDCLENSDAIAAGECALPRDEALIDTGMDEAVAATENAHLVDLSDYMCTETTCELVVGGVVVVRDDGTHLTRTFVETLTPYLERELTAILAG